MHAVVSCTSSRLLPGILTCERWVYTDSGERANQHVEGTSECPAREHQIRTRKAVVRAYGRTRIIPEGHRK